MQRLHICLNSQMFKHMCSLCILNSFFSLIKLCSIDVVDIPLESHSSYLNFYFNSLFSTKNAETALFRKSAGHFRAILIKQSCYPFSKICYVLKFQPSTWTMAPSRPIFLFWSINKSPKGGILEQLL